MSLLFSIIYILFFIFVAFVLFAIMQIKLAGMNVKDFWYFIEANDILDRLYRNSKKYDKMNAQEQIVFLLQAEKVFNAFEKVPNAVWEDEYSKYTYVLEAYKGIKMLRWAEVN